MANVNIRVDDTVKKQAEAIFSELGLSMSSATSIFYRQVVRTGGIPFELKLEPSRKKPLDLSKMTEEEIDAALQIGLDDFVADRVYSSAQVRAEMERYFRA